MTVLSYKKSRADKFNDFVLDRIHIWIPGFFIGLILTSYFV
jgi:hypothetical protein